MSAIHLEVLLTELETRKHAFACLNDEIYRNIGQMMSSSRLLIGMTERKLPNPIQSLHTANEALGKAIEDLRNATKPLQDSWISRFSILENLEKDIVSLNRLSEKTIIHFRYKEITLKLTHSEQMILYRIVSEALNISLNLGRDKSIILSLKTTSLTVTIQISNANWENMDNAADKIIYRTRLLRGEVSWKKTKRNGKLLIITLPNNPGICP